MEAHLRRASNPDARARALGFHYLDSGALYRLVALADADPRLEWVVDLAASRVTAGDQSVAVTMPDAARSALRSGGCSYDRYACRRQSRRPPSIVAAFGRAAGHAAQRQRRRAASAEPA